MAYSYDKQVALDTIKDVLKNTPPDKRKAVADKLMKQHTGLNIKGV